MGLLRVGLLVLALYGPEQSAGTAQDVPQSVSEVSVDTLEATEANFDRYPIQSAMAAFVATTLNDSARATTSRDPEPDPDDPHSIHLALAAFAGGAAADTLTTYHLLSQHRALITEVNPFLRPLADNPVALVAVKTGLAVLGSVLLYRYHTRFPRFTFWVATAGGAAYTALAIRNWHLNP